MTSRVLECRASQLEEARGALRGLFDDRRDAILVRGVYPREAIERVAQRLDRERHRLAPRDYADAERSQVEVIGEPISPSDRYPSGPEPERYFAAADGFRALCEEVFSPAVSFVERRREVLAVLADMSARELEVAGRRYGSATFRRVPPQSELALHCENLYREIPVLVPAATLADLPRTLSCFMPISPAVRGGALCIYGREPPADGDDGVTLSPAAGDMVVFAAGPRYHRVTRVEGERARWTIGGFMAPAHDDRTLWLWG